MDLIDTVVALTGATDARRLDRVQSLWKGYGEIVRLALVDGPAPTVVVKHVRPPADAHPRKLRSYRVESCWYRDFAPRLAPVCRVARCHGQQHVGEERIIVLEDLDAAGFDRRRRDLSATELDACLGWLAQLHATFLGTAPDGLWEEGTYWHLATRPDELARMRDADLRRQAPQLDAALRGARFQTLVHGDAKPANFCFAADGHVAAVDFQYVGGGCGMKDVAYLLGRQDDDGPAARGLDRYFGFLARALDDRGLGARAAAVEAEWRPLYDVAWRDYLRFLDGWQR